ncbi:ribonuclease P protein component 1 [Nitrososphaera sp.]|uniref:ribonuclease P protein component 1 n=1 Tax=Nitrososphaera sp. TaxID=1971748 RepID=UPI00307E3DE2
MTAAITADNILAHELVGLEATVVESSDPTIKGLKGTVVFETKNTISIRTTKENAAVKTVPKIAAKTIEFHTQTGACFISGATLIARPEDRISRLS